VHPVGEIPFSNDVGGVHMEGDTVALLHRSALSIGQLVRDGQSGKVCDITLKNCPKLPTKVHATARLHKVEDEYYVFGGTSMMKTNFNLHRLIPPAAGEDLAGAWDMEKTEAIPVAFDKAYPVPIAGRLAVLADTYISDSDADPLDVFLYHPDTIEWETVAVEGEGPHDSRHVVPYAREQVLFALCPNFMGFYDIYRLDLNELVWENLGSGEPDQDGNLPGSRNRCGYHVFHNRFLALGGGDKFSSEQSGVSVFDTDSFQWVSADVNGEIPHGVAMATSIPLGPSEALWIGGTLEDSTTHAYHITLRH